MNLAKSEKLLWEDVECWHKLPKNIPKCVNEVCDGSDEIEMSGSYVEYKSCTAKFVDWIKLASSAVRKSSKKLPNTLASLQERIVVITEFPRNILSLKDDLLETFQEAMLAGHRAIQLRKFVGSFHVANIDSSKNDSHRHCIKVLKHCYSSLHHWMELQKDDTKYSSESSSHQKGENSTFNVFSILNSLEEIEDELTEDSSISIDAFTSNDQTIDEVDESMGDLRLTTLCLLHDVMIATDLLQQVWKDLKAERKSILTAVTATMIAYRQICQAHAAMQLKYPSLITVDDFLGACQLENEQDSNNNNKKKKQRNHSEFITNLYHIRNTLSSMTTPFQKEIGKKERTLLIYRKGALGQPFKEMFSPLGSGFLEYIRFLGVEFARLYNNYFKCVDNEEDTKPSRFRFLQQVLTKEYYDAFIPHFEKGIVSMPEVFLVQCWLQSVQILQDRETKCLGRSLYYLRKLGRAIDSTVENYISDEALSELYDKEQKEKDPVLAMLSFCTHKNPFSAAIEYLPLHNNPILQGCVILDKLMNYLHLSTQVMQSVSGYHRAICHLYNGLKQEQYLTQDIPILEHFLHIYQSELFLGGDVPTEAGNYETQYLLASHYTAAAVASLKNPNFTRPLSKQEFIKPRNRLDSSKLSWIYALLIDGNADNFLSQHQSKQSNNNGKQCSKMLTNDQLLQAVMERMEYELFSTRYLSLKITSFHLQFYKIFKYLRGKYSIIEQAYQSCYNEGYVNEKSLATRYTLSLEHGVMKPAMLYLDSATTKAEPHTMAHSLLTSLAAELTKCFDISSDDDNSNSDDEDDDDDEVDPIEKEAAFDRLFHFLPNSPVWLVEEFGSVTYSQATEEKYQEEGTATLLEYLDALGEILADKQVAVEESGGDRTKIEVALMSAHYERDHIEKQLKKTIKAMPCVAMKFEVDSNYYLASILDHAVAGLWCFLGSEFAEWMLQMWGFNCHNKMDNTHLQIACMHGVDWAIPLLYCECEGFDLDQQSLVEGNTALHYAAERGDQKMITWLMNSANPNTQLRNHANQRACDLARGKKGEDGNDLGRLLESMGDRLQNQGIARDRDIANGESIRRSSVLNARQDAQQKSTYKKLKEEEKVHMINHAPTEAEIQKAKTAEAELLDMLDQEEKKGKTNQQGKKKPSKKK